VETRLSGAEGGPGKRAGRDAGTAPRSDPYTKLRGPVKHVFYHLYSVIDIYSRYTVGWLLAERESAELAEQLLADTIAKHGVDRNQLTIHADRGTSMASKTVAQLLSDLAVGKSHSRPHCCNDNPFVRHDVAVLRVDSQIGGRLVSAA
jgi:putative transposase